MARIKYVGKKEYWINENKKKAGKGFKLDKRYEYQKEIKPGEVFELSGNDLLLMRQSMENSKKMADGANAFMLEDEYELQQIDNQEKQAKIEKVREAKETIRKAKEEKVAEDRKRNKPKEG